MRTDASTHQRRVACPSASGPPAADGHVLAMGARASRHGHALRGHATHAWGGSH